MEFTSEQIQILLVEKLAGTIDDQDNLFIEQLLAEDEQARKQWLELQDQLQQAGGLTKEVNEDETWRKVRSLFGAPGTGKVRFMRRAATAAAIAIVLATGFLLLQRKANDTIAKAGDLPIMPAITLLLENGHSIVLHKAQTLQVGKIKILADEKHMTISQSKTAATEWSTLNVPAAFDYKITLSDGSEVWLNAQSRLRFPFSFQGLKREVYIQGEAYFKVSKDKAHPFIVHTPQTEIRVLGTQFNVNTYNDCKVETALVEGSVITRDALGSEVAIQPGEEAVYSTKHGFSTQPFDSTEVLSWMNGVYYFHNTKLKNLSKVLARWYNVEVDCNNKKLLQKTFTGKLMKGQQIQTFLDNLNLTQDMNAVVNGGRVVFQ
jgi:ferric-dicitrate binding protein FerR (iron transport regulator)